MRDVLLHDGYCMLLFHRLLLLGHGHGHSLHVVPIVRVNIVLKPSVNRENLHAARKRRQDENRPCNSGGFYRTE